jgi:galactokinase
VTGDAIAGGLVDAGLAAAERHAKARLAQRALDRWIEMNRSPWSRALWVPGRLEVFGTHTDYAGGRSLVAPVPRGFIFLAAPRGDGHIRVTDAAAPHPEASVLVDAGHRPDRHRGWRHYVEVTVARLARNFPGSPLGADIVFVSDLPRAAGMSSSSALVVGVASALADIGGLRQRVEWQQDVRSTVDEAGYLACIENGRTFGRLSGDAGVGTHGGSEDHAAMLCGTAGTFTAFRFVPMRQLTTVPLPPSWTMVVSSSGIGSHKTGTERLAYNRLSEGAEALLGLWNRSHASAITGRSISHTPAGSLAAALSSAPDATAVMRHLISRSTVPGWTTSALTGRLAHFIREDDRVGGAIAALEAADAAAFGTLAAESQRDAEELLRNQIHETPALVRAAVRAGALGARSFGAGFGGSVWALITSSDAARFADAWLSEYRTEYPEAASRSLVFVADPGPPVTTLDSRPS